MTNKIKAGEGFIPTTLEELKAASNENLFREYAESVQAIENAKALQKMMIEEVKADPKYQELEAFVQAESAAMQETETKVREIVTMEFDRTGNKKPFPGFGIREYTKVDYDLGEATNWAKANMPIALTIDKKLFEDAVKKMPASVLPDFIQVNHVPTVTISKDLSAWLVKSEE